MSCYFLFICLLILDFMVNYLVAGIFVFLIFLLQIKTVQGRVKLSKTENTLGTVGFVIYALN